MYSTALIFVLYNPNDSALTQVINVLLDKGFTCIVFDNSDFNNHISTELVELSHNFDSCHFLSYGQNVGLSSAYICSIQKALTLNLSSVLLFDQDSTISPEDVISLCSEYDSYCASNSIPAVYAATPIDSSGYPYRNRVINDIDSTHSLVKSMSSSFSIISLPIYKILGGFYHDFFIDHIDIDFCYRARKHGYAIVQNKKIRFNHLIGNGTVYLFSKPIFPVSSPFRHYYQIRNVIFSYQRSGVTSSKVTREIIKRLLVIFVTGLSHGHLFKRVKYAMKGLIHAYLGKGGKLI